MFNLMTEFYVIFYLLFTFRKNGSQIRVARRRHRRRRRARAAPRAALALAESRWRELRRGQWTARSRRRGDAQGAEDLFDDEKNKLMRLLQSTTIDDGNKLGRLLQYSRQR